MPTFFRRGDAPNFVYVDAAGHRLANAELLKYATSLVVPPKYTDVRIHYETRQGHPCAPAKLIYTGVDDKGRTQYGYSAAWKAKSAKEKYRDLIAFGTILPQIRAKVSALLANPRATINPHIDVVIALVLRIVKLCHFRLGHERYKDLYKSYGVSTIEVRHIKAISNGSAIRIAFVGKKGVKNMCDIDDPATIRHMENMVRGKSAHDPIFTYVPATADTAECSGPTCPVRAADINIWMRRFGIDLTSKSFRTFAANIMLIEQLRAAPKPEPLSAADRKKNVIAALDVVSETIHNTRAICRKEYVFPGLIDLYLNHPRRFAQLFMGEMEPEPAFLKLLRDTIGT